MRPNYANKAISFVTYSTDFNYDNNIISASHKRLVSFFINAHIFFLNVSVIDSQLAGPSSSADLRGGAGDARPPLAGQNFFIFMQFSAKIDKIIGWRPPPGSWRPLLGEIPHVGFVVYGFVTV